MQAPPELPTPPESSSMRHVGPYLIKLALSERTLWWRLFASLALMITSKAAGGKGRRSPANDAHIGIRHPNLIRRYMVCWIFSELQQALLCRQHGAPRHRCCFESGNATGPYVIWQWPALTDPKTHAWITSLHPGLGLFNPLLHKTCEIVMKLSQTFKLGKLDQTFLY